LVNHANDFLTDEDSGLPVFLEPEAVQLLRNCLRSGLNFDILLQKRKLSCLIILVISPVSSLK
ncbi:hypothetical protein PS420_09110, partial [Pediococcus acidilactici]